MAGPEEQDRERRSGWMELACKQENMRRTFFPETADMATDCIVSRLSSKSKKTWVLGATGGQLALNRPCAMRSTSRLVNVELLLTTGCRDFSPNGKTCGLRAQAKPLWQGTVGHSRLGWLGNTAPANCMLLRKVLGARLASRANNQAGYRTGYLSPSSPNPSGGGTWPSEM